MLIFQLLFALNNMKFKKIKISRIGKVFKDLPEKLARKSFLTFLSLLFIALILGSLIFYFYVYSAQGSSDLGGKSKPLETQEKTYQRVSSEWDEKSGRFSQADSKAYPNLFQPSLIATSTPTSTEELTE